MIGIAYKWGGIVATAMILLAGCSRTDDPVLGGTLDHKVLSSEFKARYAKYLTASGARDNVPLREKVLNNMLNEKLILHDLHLRGLDDDPAYQEKMRQLEDQALLDGWAKRISTDTLKVTEQELENEFRAYNSKVAVHYLYGKTVEEAFALRTRLEHGETFEQLAPEVFADPDLARSGGATGYFNYGDMDWGFEDAAFSLPIGALSDPVKFRAGFAILRVDSRIETPLASETDFARRKPKLEETIRRKKALRLVKEEADRVAAGLQAKFDSGAVALVLSHWGEIDAPPGDISRSVATAGTGSEKLFREADPSYGETPLVQFADGRWTISDLITRLRYTTTIQRRHVKAEKDVRDIVVGLASRDVLLAKARAANLDRNDLVRDQVDRLRLEWLLRRWQKIVEDTVGAASIEPAEIQKHFDENRIMYSIPPQINVAEILVRSSAEADSLARLLRRGADFSRLARENSIRTETAKKGGELGFQPPNGFGQYSKKFVDARNGDILGPLHVESFTGLYKILGKREGRPMTLDEARPLILMELLPARQQDAFQKAVEKLRSTYGVTLDMQELANVNISPN